MFRFDFTTFLLHSGGFHIGKVVNVNVNESLINVTLFHYKMDTEMISATKDDVIMNFGQHQAKSIFKMSDDQQKMLLDQLIERRKKRPSILSLIDVVLCHRIGSDSSSLLSLIAQLETKNRVSVFDPIRLLRVARSRLTDIRHDRQVIQRMTVWSSSPFVGQCDVRSIKWSRRVRRKVISHHFYTAVGA